LDPTLVAARILGPLFVFAGVLLITRPDRVISSIAGFLTNPSLMTLAGFVTLIIGLVLITFHQRWDTITACLITIIGWAFLARGAIMLLAPDLILESANFVERQRQSLPIGGCIAALLGVWFTYTGYVAGMLRFDHPTR
jgi:hypothetical protein